MDRIKLETVRNELQLLESLCAVAKSAFSDPAGTPNPEHIENVFVLVCEGLRSAKEMLSELLGENIDKYLEELEAQERGEQ